MLSEPARELKCDVNGLVILSSAIGDIEVNAQADRVSVTLPELVDLQFDKLISGTVFHQKIVSGLHDTLKTMDVQLAVYMSGRVIALLGRGAKPGVIFKSLVKAPVEVRLFPLMSALLRAKSARIERRLRS